MSIEKNWEVGDKQDYRIYRNFIGDRQIFSIIFKHLTNKNNIDHLINVNSKNLKISVDRIKISEITAMQFRYIAYFRRLLTDENAPVGLYNQLGFVFIKPIGRGLFLCMVEQIKK
ncbi:hypothetical protein ACJX0J_016957, partial [Zea mays]